MSDQPLTLVAWYAEQKQFDGTYKPVVFHQQTPPDKTSTGSKRDLRNVRCLDFLGWNELTLEELHERFNDWEPPEDHAAYSEPSEDRPSDEGC